MEVENLDDQNISATKPKNKIQTENELKKNLKQSSTSYPKCPLKLQINQSKPPIILKSKPRNQ